MEQAFYLYSCPEAGALPGVDETLRFLAEDRSALIEPGAEQLTIFM